MMYARCKQVNSRINDKNKESKEERSHTQEFIVEVRLIVYVPTISVAT